MIGSDLIEAIYQAPLAARPFADLAAALRGQFRCHGAMFRFAPRAMPGDCERFVFDAGWDVRESWPLYDSVYRHLDPTWQREMAVGEIHDLDTLLDSGEAGPVGEYARFCRSLGIGHGFYAYLGEYGGVTTWLALSRTPEEGRFDAGDAASMRDLLPHFGRAIDIHARLESARHVGAVLGSTLADLGIGCILVGAGRTILSANQAAEGLLADGRTLAAVDGRLVARGEARQRFADLVAAAANGAVLSEGVVIRSGGDAEAHVRVVSRAALGGDGGPHGAVAAVYVEGLADRKAPSRDAIVRRFGLTPAEAGVAGLLAVGRTLDQAAGELGITAGSARIYCKRALAKTGTARQAELVGLIWNSVARIH